MRDVGHGLWLIIVGGDGKLLIQAMVKHGSPVLDKQYIFEGN